MIDELKYNRDSSGWFSLMIYWTSSSPEKKKGEIIPLCLPLIHRPRCEDRENMTITNPNGVIAGTSGGGGVPDPPGSTIIPSGVRISSPSPPSTSVIVITLSPSPTPIHHRRPHAMSLLLLALLLLHLSAQSHRRYILLSSHIPPKKEKRIMFYSVTTSLT